MATFRQAVHRGMAAAMQETKRQAAMLYKELLSGGAFEKVIIDKEEFQTALPLGKFVETSADASHESTINSLDAATIVFAHSMVDSAAMDYCRVTALHAPADWEPDLLSKQIPLDMIRGQTYDQIREAKLEQTLVELERASLREKIDRLHARCKPQRKWSPMTDYAFDPGRIGALDRLRQEIVHGDALGKPITDVETELDYMNKTCMYFMGLVNFRYRLRIDPNFAFGSLSRR